MTKASPHNAVTRRGSLRLPTILGEFETELDIDESSQASPDYCVARRRIIGSSQIAAQLGEFDGVSSKWLGG